MYVMNLIALFYILITLGILIFIIVVFVKKSKNQCDKEGFYEGIMAPITNRKQHLKVWGWGINENLEKVKGFSEPFLKTCAHWNIKPELIGVGVKFANWETDVKNKDGRWAGHGLQRFYVLRDALEGLKDNQLVLVMDTADTLIAGSADEIVSRFEKLNTDILISAEAGFTYQYPVYQKKYDKNNTKTMYKYIAAGTYMGYAGALKKMCDKCIEICCVDTTHHLYNRVEMGVLGVWVHDNLVPNQSMSERALVRLDTNCNIFWVTSYDNENYLKALESKGNIFHNSKTNTNPIIMHLVGGVTRKRIKEGIKKILT